MTPTPRVLIAGVGNIFLGDDAFGVEVVRRLMSRPLPDGVRAVDFGIRALDLALSLEACDAAILVDATSRGAAPGTLYVIEPSRDRASLAAESAHAMTPESALACLAPGAGPAWIRVVGCEVARRDEEDDDESMSLSAPVRAALDEAVALVERLVDAYLAEARRA